MATGSKTTAKSRDTLKSVRKDIDSIVTRLETVDKTTHCLLYTSPSPRDLSTSRMPSSA